jgi:hypothetical protein
MRALLFWLEGTQPEHPMASENLGIENIGTLRKCRPVRETSEPIFIVPYWGRKSTMVQGFRTGPSAYVA